MFKPFSKYQAIENNGGKGWYEVTKIWVYKGFGVGLQFLKFRARLV